MSPVAGGGAVQFAGACKANRPGQGLRPQVGGDDGT